MKKKVIILMHYMMLGGAENALLGLLQSLDTDRMEVDLFLYDMRGELVPYIPRDKVRVLPTIPAYTMLERPLAEVVRRGFLRLALMRLYGRYKASRDARLNTQGKDDISSFSRQQQYTVRVLPDINPEVEYDLAISFLIPHYIVVDRVRARERWGWIHTDYSMVYVNAREELKMWGRLDRIVSISDDVTRCFCNVFPSLADKVIKIENILPTEYIMQRADETVEFKPKGTVSLLSIGRFCYPKRFDEIGTLCRIVREQGLDVHWYIIGYGGDEQKIRENIHAEGMDHHVTLLGKQSNPYPYLKRCDIYVQPSRYEGHSVTVREAQALGKPVVVSNYATAASQITHGLDGYIVPMETEPCALGIADFIRNVELQKKITGYLGDHKSENQLAKTFILGT